MKDDKGIGFKKCHKLFKIDEDRRTSICDHTFVLELEQILDFRKTEGEAITRIKTAIRKDLKHDLTQVKGIKLTFNIDISESTIVFYTEMPQWIALLLLDSLQDLLEFQVIRHLPSNVKRNIWALRWFSSLSMYSQLVDERDSLES